MISWSHLKVTKGGPQRVWDVYFQTSQLCQRLGIGFPGLLSQITTNLVAVNNRNLLFLNSRGQESKIKILAGLIPSVCENLFHVFLLDFGGCCSPWHVAAWLWSLPLSFYDHLLCVSLYLKFFSFLLWGYQSLDLRLFEDDLILRSLIISSKTLFPNEVAVTGTGVSTKMYCFAGHNLTLYRLCLYCVNIWVLGSLV